MLVLRLPGGLAMTLMPVPRPSSQIGRNQNWNGRRSLNP
jgi:hypothetical protein